MTSSCFTNDSFFNYFEHLNCFSFHIICQNQLNYIFKKLHFSPRKQIKKSHSNSHLVRKTDPLKFLQSYFFGDPFLTNEKMAPLLVFRNLCQKPLSLADFFQLHKYQALAFINMSNAHKRQKGKSKLVLEKFGFTIIVHLKMLLCRIYYLYFSSFDVTFVKYFVEKKPFSMQIF